MDKQKLDDFKKLLLEQRHRALDDFRNDRALGHAERDGAIDSGEAAELDADESTALELAGRESDLVEEVDAALQRIDEGTYGICERCGKPISEERLKALPTARYHVECQAAIEEAEGLETPSL